MKKWYNIGLIEFNLNRYILEIGFLFILIFTILLIIIYKKKIFNIKAKKYIAIQKIHEGFTPRIGGLIIAIFFYLWLVIDNKTDSFFFNKFSLIPALLIIIVGGIEDIYNNKVPPYFRLIIIFFGSVYFTYNLDSLPLLEIWYFGSLINEYSWLQILFYSICITALCNGMNMIDGMHGLLSFNTISILFSIIIFLQISSIKITYLAEIFFLISLFIVFIIFNFPFGKIFLGDAGAYWIGWILGTTVIDIFSNTKLNTWGAVLILSYPVIEVVFSTLRKSFKRHNPLKADRLHLHLKLFDLLTKNIEKKNINLFSALTTLILMPLWIAPLIYVPWVNFHSYFAIIFTLISSSIYFYLYLIIPKNY